MLNVPVQSEDLGNLVEEARKTSGCGGEGPAHRALKLFIRDNPQVVGLPKGSKPGREEHLIASGDRIDVTFLRPRLWLAVEVKSHHSDEGDVVRGAFQCLKYRTVLEAKASLTGKDVEVRVLLVLGGWATSKARKLTNLINIAIKANVRIS